jgi:hypothetical protein
MLRERSSHPEHQDLELVTKDLVRLSKRQAATSWPKAKDETEEKTLHALSDACVRVSNELLERLSKHKVARGSPMERRWKSFRETLETVWSKKDLEGLATRLEQLRSEMSLHVLVAFKYGPSQCVQKSRLTRSLESSLTWKHCRMLDDLIG